MAATSSPFPQTPRGPGVSPQPKGEDTFQIPCAMSTLKAITQ